LCPVAIFSAQSPPAPIYTESFRKGLLQKVERFYIILQVKAHHFAPPDLFYLDSMTVSVEFTNADPRTAKINQTRNSYEAKKK
jgi:hypothetical protein